MRHGVSPVATVGTVCIDVRNCFGVPVEDRYIRSESRLSCGPVMAKSLPLAAWPSLKEIGVVRAGRAARGARRQLADRKLRRGSI